MEEIIMEGTALKIVPEVEEVGIKALSVIDQAKALEIINSETYIKAGSFITTIKEMIKEVEDTFTPICEAAFKAHRLAVEKRDYYLNPLKNAQKSIKGLMNSYDLAEEQKRLEEQRKLEEIARRVEEERKLREAIEAEEAGEQEVAEAIMEEAVYVPPVVLPKETPKVKGISFRTIWDFEIVNASLLPRQYLTPDLVKIGGVVRSLKDQANIPGVKVFSKRV
jgi:hypothetical protein